MTQTISIEYLRPGLKQDGPSGSPSGTLTQQAWACIPARPSDSERTALKNKIRDLLRQHNALLVAHYYVDGDLQDLAEETGGCVSDSLEMARFGRDSNAQTLVVCGVRFMGETAKILSPEKRVFMPDLQATCSLDLGCPAEEFTQFCDAHPDRTVVVYANTSAAVKARADWMVTSSIGLKIVEHLHAQGKKILWAPDKHLGQYIQQKTGADMLLWQGACVVHDEFKGLELAQLKVAYPNARVLVHPESPESVVQLADVVGSTSQLIKATQANDCAEFIVATDNGILHKMRALSPQKKFIEAPTAGNGASCKSCAHCPWMAMNSLQNLADTLEKNLHSSVNEIFVDPAIGQRAWVSIDRMLQFAASTGITQASGNLAKMPTLYQQTFSQGMGPA